MNLIEQLGGYESAKSKFRDNGSLHAERLKKVLLEYRRQHNIFEVNDKVVFNSDKSDDLDLYIVDAVLDDGSFLCINGYRQAFPPTRFRHATPSEISAGHRL